MPKLAVDWLSNLAGAPSMAEGIACMKTATLRAVLEVVTPDAAIWHVVDADSLQMTMRAVTLELERREIADR